MDGDGGCWVLVVKTRFEDLCWDGLLQTSGRAEGSLELRVIVLQYRCVLCLWVSTDRITAGFFFLFCLFVWF